MNDNRFFKYIGGAMTILVGFIIIYSIAFPNRKKDANSKDETQQIEKTQEKTTEEWQCSGCEKRWAWIKENPIKTAAIVVGAPIALMITLIILGHIRLWMNDNYYTELLKKNTENCKNKIRSSEEQSKLNEIEQLQGEYNTYWKNSSYLYQKIAFGFRHPIVSIKNWREDKDYITEFNYINDIGDEDDYIEDQRDGNPSNRYHRMKNNQNKHQKGSHQRSNRSHQKSHHKSNRSNISNTDNDDNKESEDIDNNNQQKNEIDDNDDEIEHDQLNEHDDIDNNE